MYLTKYALIISSFIVGFLGFFLLVKSKTQPDFFDDAPKEVRYIFEIKETADVDSLNLNSSKKNNVAAFETANNTDDFPNSSIGFLLKIVAVSFVLLTMVVGYRMISGMSFKEAIKAYYIDDDKRRINYIIHPTGVIVDMYKSDITGKKDIEIFQITDPDKIKAGMKNNISLIIAVIFLCCSCSNEKNLEFDYTADCSIKELRKYDLKDNGIVTFRDSDTEYRKYETLPYMGSGLYYGKGVHSGGIINLREAGVGKHLIVFTPNGQDQWHPFFITIIDSRNTWDKIFDN